MNQNLPSNLTLAQGFAPRKFLEEMNYPEGVVGVAVNSRGQVLECISYDKSNTEPDKSVFTSMVYNGWIEDGKKQSAFRYTGPNALYKDFQFKSLITQEDKQDFMKVINLNP